jgi:hypothetical protein
MMLGHEVFAPETSKRVPVDHSFIVAGGEITKAARKTGSENIAGQQSSYAGLTPYGP